MNFSALVIILITILAAWFLWRTAHRIDKLHRKVVAAKIALDQQLQRRAEASIDLAMSQILDPASAMMLANEAYTVLDELTPLAETDYPMSLAPISKHREIAESELTECLRQIFPDEQAIAEVRSFPTVTSSSQSIGYDLLYRVTSAWYRAELARRFYNQAVADARAARRHWYVRAFRLAGHARLPETCELDDALPPELARTAVTPLG